MEIAGYSLTDWATRRYEFVQDGVGIGNYSSWDLIAMLDSHQIDTETQVRLVGNKESYPFAESQVYKHIDSLRPFAGTPMQVMLFDSLEKLRARFLWWSIGVGIMLFVFLMFGIRVYVTQ